MRKSEGQKIPEKEIVKQKFCKNFERGRILVRRARRCNREDLEQFQFDGVMDMKIREVNENKKQFISLLLLADEQASMVDRYLEKGTMYVLEDNDVKAECVVTDEGNEILEIKNIAVDPENQGKGYGKALIDFLASKYADEYSILQVGTDYRIYKAKLQSYFYHPLWFVC